MTAEQVRLDEARENKAPWKKWFIVEFRERRRGF